MSNEAPTPMQAFPLNEAEKFLLAKENEVLREAKNRMNRALLRVCAWALDRAGLPRETPVFFVRNPESGEVVSIRFEVPEQKVDPEPSTAEALEALEGLQRDAKKSGLSKMTDAQIDREIAAVRSEMAAARSAKKSRGKHNHGKR